VLQKKIATMIATVQPGAMAHDLLASGPPSIVCVPPIFTKQHEATELPGRPARLENRAAAG